MRVIAVFLLVLATPLARAEKRAAVVVASQIAQPGAVNRVRTDLAAAGFAVTMTDEQRRVLEGEVRVDPDLDPLEGLLRDAQDAYERFELGEALSKLQELDERASAVDATPAFRALLSRRYLLSGLVWSHTGKDQAAISDFRLAYQLAPSRRELERGLYRPVVVVTYAKAVAQTQRAAKIRLNRSVQPAFATLWIDGVPLPETLELTRGPHWLEITAAGYRPVRRVLDADTETAVKESLVPLTGKERLESLRRAAIAADSTTVQTVDQLAAALEVDVVVLVRPGSAGAEALVHRSGASELGPWFVVGTTGFLAALGTERSPAQRAAAASDTSAPATSTASPWYKEWWGVGLLAGGGAVVATTLFFVLSADNGAQNARIEQWCFNQCN